VNVAPESQDPSRPRSNVQDRQHTGTCMAVAQCKWYVHKQYIQTLCIVVGTQNTAN